MQAMLKMVAPKTVSELQRALGMFNYYRRFVRGYSTRAAAMLQLVNENGKGRGSDPIPYVGRRSAESV